MRRSISLLVALLVVQLGLAGLLAARRNPLAATTPQTALISAPLDQVDHITIEAQPAAGAPAGSARVELLKRADQWVLPDYFNAPADKFRLSSVLSELGALKRGLPIATSSEALRRFKLVDANFERRVTLRHGDRVLSTLYFGSSAGARKTDARTAQDHAVYDVDLATYELPTSPSDWLDEDILQRDPASLSEVDIEATHDALKLVRAPSAPAAKAAAAHAAAPAAAPTTAPVAPAWTDPALPAGRQLDAARADNLAREIGELHVEAILGTNPDPQWQPAHPALTLQIRTARPAAQPVTWTLYAPLIPAMPTAAKARAPTAAGAHSAGAHSPGEHAAGAPTVSPAVAYYVLKDSAQPWYFKLSSVAGKQLLDDSSPEQLLVAVTPAGKAAAHARPEVSAARTHRALRQLRGAAGVPDRAAAP